MEVDDYHKVFNRGDCRLSDCELDSGRRKSPEYQAAESTWPVNLYNHFCYRFTLYPISYGRAERLIRRGPMDFNKYLHRHCAENCRNSGHLQEGTAGPVEYLIERTIGMASISFILACAISIFHYIIDFWWTRCVLRRWLLVFQVDCGCIVILVIGR